MSDSHDFIGVALAELYQSFPVPLTIEKKTLADKLGIYSKRKAWEGPDAFWYGTLSDGKDFEDVFRSAFVWMRHEALIRSYGSYATENAVMTSKAVSALSVRPQISEIADTLGDALALSARLFENGSDKLILGRFVREAYGAVTANKATVISDFLPAAQSSPATTVEMASGSSAKPSPFSNQPFLFSWKLGRMGKRSDSER